MHALQVNHLQRLVVRLHCEPASLEICVEVYAGKDDGKQFSLNIGVSALCSCQRLAGKGDWFAILYETCSQPSQRSVCLDNNFLPSIVVSKRL